MVNCAWLVGYREQSLMLEHKEIIIIVFIIIIAVKQGGLWGHMSCLWMIMIYNPTYKSCICPEWWLLLAPCLFSSKIQ